MTGSAIVLWMRRDLRLADNPALAEAAAAGVPVVPVYVHEPDAGQWAAGSASRWWLGGGLAAFAESLAGLGGWLVVRQGPPEEVLLDLARATGAGAVYWNRRYVPHQRIADERVAQSLAAAGVQVRTFKSALLFEPWELTPRPDQPYQLFAPFWNACLAAGEPERPLPAPARLAVPAQRPGDDVPAAVADPPAATGWAAAWEVGEAAAQRRLDAFVAAGLNRYAVARDHPDQAGTSRLSPHLAFGEIGPRQVWHAVRAASAYGGDVFLRELGWREFCYHMLHFAPFLPNEPLRDEFTAFPWLSDAELFAAWRDGRTGYPIVDAGMRCLAATGWLHNRVRMIVASFLTKDLLMPWQIGEAWFWESLVDADLACNAANWQWVAGCGIDAAPYFRIFNPVLQGEKFDARGRFVRQWLPELAALPDMFIHGPAKAPSAVLAKAGVRLGADYPRPVIEHGAARRRAMAAFEQMRGVTLADPARRRM